MDMHALADLVLVADHGGFGRASRASGRAKATLSRRVADLETALGVKLMERGVQGLRLTDEGRALVERARGPLGELAELEDAVRLGAATPQGRLRVSAPVVLCHVALGRIAARFAARYPAVQLEIVAEDRKVDPIDDDYDLVLRVDPHPDERLVGRPVLDDRRLLVASPALALGLAAATGEGAGAATIASPIPAVLQPRTAPGLVWEVRTDQDEVRTYLPQAALRLSSLMMVRDAVLDGAGAALLPGMLVQPDVDAGRLQLLGASTGPGVQVWALRHSRRLPGARVRAFLDLIEASFPDRVFRLPR